MNNYINNDTITAISTPVGVGAIAMIRMSGTESLEILDCFFRHSANTTIGHRTCVYGQIYDNCELVDDVIVTYYKSPESYTGEDMVEISCHGSVYIQQTILDLIVRNGARLALPGEFTFRAYRNGKLDLAQSEAVSELITSENKKSHDIAISQLKGRYSSRIKSLRDRLVELLSLLELELDFSDEDVEFAKRDEFMALLDTLESELKSLINSFDLGNALRNGIPVTIIGKPNVGKSTLLNCLLDEDKAIVSDIPGTTRDIVEDVININGYVFRFIDTAGLHKTDDKKKITRITAASAAAGLGFNVIFEPVIGYLYRRYLLGTSAEAASILSAWLGGVTAFNAVVCLFVSVLLYRALYKQYRSLV